MNLRYGESFIRLTLILLFSTRSIAFTLPESIQELPPNKHAMINERAHQQLQAALEQHEKGNTESSLKQLEAIVNRYQHNPVLVSYALRSAVHLLASQNRLSEAEKLATTTLNLASLKTPELQEIRYFLAQLYASQQDFAATIKHMNKWFELSSTEPSNEDQYYLLAYAHYQQEEYAQAINTVRKTLKQHEGPPEKLLGIMLNAQLSHDEYISGAIDTLKQLISVFPHTKRYWTSLINLYQRGQNRKQALAVMELMRETFTLTEQELIQFAHLLLDQKLPHRAAEFIQQGLDSGTLKRNEENKTLLSYAWDQAGETHKAITALNDSQNMSEITLQHLTQLFARQQNWIGIIKLSKQYDNMFSQNIDLSILLGQAHYRAGQHGRALEVFNRIYVDVNGSETYTEQILQWKSFLQQLNKSQIQKSDT